MNAIRAPMTLDQFLARDWELGDGLKYEWHDGFVEAGEERMKSDEAGIMRRLLRLFGKSAHYEQGVDLLPGLEIRFPASKSYRIPDFSALTEAQVQAAERGEIAIPGFVIEVISAHDNAIHLEKKLREYFDSGVQVVWHVFPDFNTVRIFHSVTESTGREGDQVCSAAPAFPDFSIKASEIFA